MEEKTKTTEVVPVQPYPQQEITSFPKDGNAAVQKEGEVHLLSAMYGSRSTNISEVTPKPKENTEEIGKSDYIRFIRELATADDAKREEILAQIKGKGDEELLAVVKDTVHGLDVDAQVALTQGQQLAVERQAQLSMATQTEQKETVWNRIKKRLWTQNAA